MNLSLGKTTLSISPLGIGAWQWGDSFVWGYGKGGYTDADLRAAFRATLDAGINFYDTAEVYGNGRSETLLGEFVRAEKRPVVLATKFMPLPWRLTKGALLNALRHSLKRMGVESVDLYQIHWPYPPIAIETWMQAMAEAHQAGLIRAVGVSNYSEDQMRRAHAELAKHNLPLAANQVSYSLLNKEPERNGVLRACRELGITLIAYSPLAMGMLSGKYTAATPPPDFRKWRFRRQRMEKLTTLIGHMKAIGQTHGGKTPSQVALNWLMRKGAVPIPGFKNLRQAQDNLGALGWQLTDADMATLDTASDAASNLQQ